MFATLSSARSRCTSAACRSRVNAVSVRKHLAIHVQARRQELVGGKPWISSGGLNRLPRCRDCYRQNRDSQRHLHDDERAVGAPDFPS
jgi:hypothetical protein